MQQIKIFKGIETDLTTLERDVNTWIKSSNAQVSHIFGNMSPQTPQSTGTASILGAERMAGKTFVASDVLIVVLYEASR